MKKETFESLVAIQKCGTCNMLDLNCINQIMDDEISKETLWEFINNYDELYEKYISTGSTKKYEMNLDELREITEAEYNEIKESTPLGTLEKSEQYLVFKYKGKLYFGVEEECYESIFNVLYDRGYVVENEDGYYDPVTKEFIDENWLVTAEEIGLIELP